MQAYASDAVSEAFAASYARFTQTIAWLSGRQAAEMTHGELEARLHTDGLAILRQLLQDSLDLRAERERRVESVVDADGLRRGSVEAGHERGLATIFGEVTVARLAYRSRGLPNLHPADAKLNLPPEKHSHGLRRLAVLEAVRGSYDAASQSIERTSGVLLGKRQIEQLVTRAAVDVEAFYPSRGGRAGADTDALVLTFDAKGVVMRPDALRETTARTAASRKLGTRLSRGEKRCRKRMAELASVYDLTPVPRRVVDILPDEAGTAPARAAPTAAGRWLCASLLTDAATVIAAGFVEADRRDPQHRRDWIALVDGNVHQIQRIQAEARRHRISVTIVVDLIHVIEYLWKAAWCFHPEGDRHAETWVREQTRKILQGKAGIVAAAIRRKATYQRLQPAQRLGADTAATYLINKKRWLDYPTALTKGWPIATGVIEGACRHLVADRMDIAGARWGLTGAEAILKLRAVIANGDFDTYWTFHLNQEHQRVHKTRYVGGVIPTQ